MKNLKLARHAGVIHVIDSSNTILGQLSLQEIEAIIKPDENNIKGFVKRVRVLWVNNQDPSQVYCELIIKSFKQETKMRGYITRENIKLLIAEMPSTKPIALQCKNNIITLQ